jgi:hypothetical protein
VQELQKLAAGTDVDRALSEVDRQLDSPDIGTQLLPLKPPGRRKSIPIDVAASAIAGGGLAKGNASYFDIYDCALQYIGSVKVRQGTVFSEDVSNYFPTLSLAVKRITDGLSWERSQSVYAALPSSNAGLFLLREESHAAALRNLKKAVAD